MSRRLAILSSVILVLFALVVVQAANIQFVRAPSLNASSLNPRNNTVSTEYPRGEIVAANGTILAQSEATGDNSYPYRRVYPLGPLTAGVVGFTSPFTEPWGMEAEYNSYLTAHAQPASSSSSSSRPRAPPTA